MNGEGEQETSSPSLSPPSSPSTPSTPSRPSPPSSSPSRILLIQSEWPARALLAAELEERGFEVLASDSLPTALDLAMTRGFRPDLIVVDSMWLTLEPGYVERLLFLRANSPLLLIVSAQYAEPRVLAPTRVLSRPVTVGEIADAAEQLASL